MAVDPSKYIPPWFSNVLHYRGGGVVKHLISAEFSESLVMLFGCKRDQERLGMIDACLLKNMHTHVRGSGVHQQLSSRYRSEVSFSQNGMLRSAHGIFAVHGALYALVQALVKSLHGTDPPHAKHTGLLQGQGVRDSKAQICIHDKIYCKCTGVRIMAAVYEACDSVSLGE